MMSVFESNQTHKASMYHFITWPTIFCLCNQNSDYERKEELLTLLNMTAYNTVTCSINIYTLRSPVLKDVSLEWNGQKLLWDVALLLPQQLPQWSPRLRDCLLPHSRCFSKNKNENTEFLRALYVILFHVHATRFLSQKVPSRLMKAPLKLLNSTADGWFKQGLQSLSSVTTQWVVLFHSNRLQ